jgi:hypothetical protein
MSAPEVHLIAGALTGLVTNELAYHALCKKPVRIKPLIAVVISASISVEMDLDHVLFWNGFASNGRPLHLWVPFLAGCCTVFFLLGLMISKVYFRNSRNITKGAAQILSMLSTFSQILLVFFAVFCVHYFLDYNFMIYCLFCLFGK